MRIGVVVAVDEDLLAIGVDRQARGLFPIDPRGAQAGQIRGLDSRHPARGQHPAGRVLGDHLGEQHVGPAREVGRDDLHRRGFLAIVELGQDHLANLAVDRAKAPLGHELAQQAEDALQGAQVGLDDLLDVRVLHLDRDLAAVLEAREMHLPDRRRSDRGPIELREDFVGTAPTELLAQTRLDVLVGPGRNLVLQAFEPAAKRLGEEVGHDADQLADLDEQALQLDHRLLDPAGVAPVGLLGDLLQLVRAHEAALEREPQVRGRHQQRGGVGAQQPPPGWLRAGAGATGRHRCGGPSRRGCRGRRSGGWRRRVGRGGGGSPQPGADRQGQGPPWWGAGRSRGPRGRRVSGQRRRRQRQIFELQLLGLLWHPGHGSRIAHGGCPVPGPRPCGSRRPRRGWLPESAVAENKAGIPAR